MSRRISSSPSADITATAPSEHETEYTLLRSALARVEAILGYTKSKIQGFSSTEPSNWEVMLDEEEERLLNSVKGSVQAEFANAKKHFKTLSTGKQRGSATSFLQNFGANMKKFMLALTGGLKTLVSHIYEFMKGKWDALVSRYKGMEEAVKAKLR